MRLTQLQARHQLVVLNALLLLTAAAGVWFAVTNMPRGLILLAVLEAAMAIFALLLFWRLRSTGYSRSIARLYLLVFYAVMMVALLQSAASSTVFIWVLLIPVPSYFMLGRIEGFRITLGYFSLSLIIYLYRSAGTEAMGVMELSNVVICATALWTLAHAYELGRETAAGELRALATTDPLTGLKNRLQLEEILSVERSRVAREGGCFALLLLDLDHFKAVNDRFGHVAGDRVLQRLAGLLQKRLRGSDWAFRVGGEEFCVLLPGADRQKALALAQSLRRHIADSLAEPGEEAIRLTASMGVAVYPEDGEDLDTLYGRADSRLYRAKAQGRDQVVLD